MSTVKGINNIADLRRWLPQAQIETPAGGSRNSLPAGGMPAGIQEAGRGPRLVEPGISIEANRLVILIAAQTVNEGNQRQWKARNRRAGQAWRAVREAIGPNLAALEPFARHLAAGGAVRAKFTRLGGRRLDQLANLGTSFKGVEDALCYLLGIDDRSPQWHPVPEQEPGGDVGVRVVLEIYK